MTYTDTERERERLELIKEEDNITNIKEISN
jgi:hypothetical protein